MTMWEAVLLACAACFVLKVAGYVVPARWLAGPVVARVSTLLPVALLAALVAVQSFTTTGGRLVVDARLAAVAVAIVLLWRKANFVVVVLAAATVAALLRALGWAS